VNAMATCSAAPSREQTHGDRLAGRWLNPSQRIWSPEFSPELLPVELALVELLGVFSRRGDTRARQRSTRSSATQPPGGHWVVDGNLVTGQNQNAAPMVARELMQILSTADAAEAS